MKKIFVLSSIAVLIAGCSAAPQTPVEATAVAEAESTHLQSAQSAFLENVDVKYSYDFANKLTEIKSNPVLGYRTAGSEAEFLTGEVIKAEMESIGLTNVNKDEIPVDAWTFETAQIRYTDTDGNEQTLELGGYQTNFTTDGFETYTVILGGDGTAADYEDLDVEGKLVLIDINQRENWWINYPAYEAYLHGAAGVLAAQDGGYAEISDEALNTQDMCGPDYAPAFSISRKDATALQTWMEENGVNEMEVQFNAKSEVVLDSKTYNITGMIEGKNPDSIVLMSAHYDSYYTGFQDDNAAIALMMGIAKSLVESGVQPEKTLLFCAMAAEEWGVSDSRYDWSTGAYNQITMAHPEWVGKVVADINFELPAMDEGTTNQIRTSYELHDFTADFLPSVPTIEGIFPDGVEIIVPTQTWSDDFSLSIAGIPSCVNALRGGFAKTHYHSQFDNKDTYSENAYLFNYNMYGMYMLALNECAVSPLSFTTRIEALRDSVDQEMLEKYGADADGLADAIQTALTSAEAAYAKVQEYNHAYQEALNAGDEEKASIAFEAAQACNDKVLEAFKFAEDNFVKLTWEDVSIFAHEHSQTNLEAYEGAIAALEENDAATAVDEYLWVIDNNWYTYDFSKETYEHFTNYVLDAPEEKTKWGTGRIVGHEGLYDEVQSLLGKYEDENADCSEELAVITAAKDREVTRLLGSVQSEIEALSQLSTMLNEIAE